ncbi:phosphoribosyltransferase family protein [Seonamhaeicola sp.]|uniref:phosphoribosyltransferase family protein n=1 Tax=Seonamhaeicola sp. TaxID=1912245 RepID=UPI00262E53D5|nr:phosphoribosyltransferase family protein [Seonamhaeicola sp.]
MEVVTLNHKDFKLKCAELVSKIETQPDLIVGVLNGGGYILNAIKGHNDLNGVAFNSVKQQRDSKFKNNIIVKSILKRLPYRISNSIRVFESENAKKTINKINLKDLSDISLDLNTASGIIEPKYVLIVDDAIDTGKAMYITKNSLSKLFPKAKIETAVISWTIDASIIKPDYYLYKNILVRFPWSKDYKGKDFEKNSFSS